MQDMSFNAAQGQVIEAQLASARQSMQGASTGDANKAAAREAAEQFEAVFLSSMLAPMFESLPTDGAMGGGHAESLYRGMFVEEAGKQIARNGGIGIADQVYAELLKLQEG